MGNIQGRLYCQYNRLEATTIGGGFSANDKRNAKIAAGLLPGDSVVAQQWQHNSTRMRWQAVISTQAVVCCYCCAAVTATAHAGSLEDCKYEKYTRAYTTHERSPARQVVITATHSAVCRGAVSPTCWAAAMMPHVACRCAMCLLSTPKSECMSGRVHMLSCVNSKSSAVPSACSALNQARQHCRM